MEFRVDSFPLFSAIQFSFSLSFFKAFFETHNTRRKSRTGAVSCMEPLLRNRIEGMHYIITIINESHNHANTNCSMTLVPFRLRAPLSRETIFSELTHQIVITIYLTISQCSNKWNVCDGSTIVRLSSRSTCTHSHDKISSPAMIFSSQKSGVREAPFLTIRPGFWIKDRVIPPPRSGIRNVN